MMTTCTQWSAILYFQCVNSPWLLTRASQWHAGIMQETNVFWWWPGVRFPLQAVGSAKTSGWALWFSWAKIQAPQGSCHSTKPGTAQGAFGQYSQAQGERHRAVLCRARAWARSSSWLPSDSADSVLLWPIFATFPPLQCCKLKQWSTQDCSRAIAMAKHGHEELEDQRAGKCVVSSLCGKWMQPTQSTAKGSKCSGTVSADRTKKVFHAEILFQRKITAKLGVHVHKGH